MSDNETAAGIGPTGAPLDEAQESDTEVCSREGHLAASQDALLRADEVEAGYLPGVSILNGTDLYADEGELT